MYVKTQPIKAKHVKPGDRIGDRMVRWAVGPGQAGIFAALAAGGTLITFTDDTQMEVESDADLMVGRVDRENLNDVMEFDHVIRVHENGSVTDDEPNIWAPDVAFAGGKIEMDPTWKLMDGYSGQYAYSGPAMHDSEYIGGRLADDILSTPGVYAAVVIMDHDNATEDETPDAGWAVARLVEVPASYPVRPLTTFAEREAAGDEVTCHECGRAWDDSIVTSMTPAPGGRCPFEVFH